MIHPVNDGSLTIEDMRERIDVIDRSIVSLLAERAAYSHHVQVAKVGSGEPRVDLGRERQVIQTYADALGQRGTEVGHAVLLFSRGRVTSAVPYQSQGSQVPGDALCG